jgi:hypothetical protein
MAAAGTVVLPPALAERWRRLEREREAVLASLAGQDDVQLRFRPAPDAWSSRDVVEHLVLVEELVGSRVGKATGPTGWRGRLALQIMRVASTMRARVRAPLPAILPTGDDPLPLLAARWSQARARLHAHLVTLDTHGLGQPLLRHPVAGPLSAPQGLDFLSLHITHHRRQLQRIRSSQAFPGR